MARGKGPVSGFQINVVLPELRVHDEAGRFTSAQREMHQQNRELAQVLQSKVGRVLENNLLRPGVSSGRLLRATMDPKNREYSWDHAAVGNVQWLDRGIAKYWRTIEEGSAKTWTKRSFLDLPLQGIWGMDTATWHTSAAGDDWIGLGSRSRGRRGQEMYHPFRYGPGANLPVFHPTRHIRPQGAYKYAADENYIQRHMLVGAVKFWNRILSDGISPRGFRGGIYDHGI